MTIVTVWHCHPVGNTSVTYYVATEGSYPSNLVPSGYNVCSDPFLQNVVSASDGTNYEYYQTTGTLDYDTECRLTANQTTLGGSIFGLDATADSGFSKDTLYAITQTNNSNPWYTNCNHATIHTDFYFPYPVQATNVILQHRGGSKAHLYYGMIYAGDSQSDLANHTYTLYDSGFVNRGGGAYVNTSVTPSRGFQYYRVDWHNSGSDGGSNGGMIYIKFEGTKTIHTSSTYNLADSDSVKYFSIVPCSVDYPYAHYNGTIYPIADAPSGAFGITASEKASLEAAVSAGGTLRWYSDQRPYVDKYVAWTQPVLTSDSTSTTLGTVTATASSYGTAGGNEYPYHAMDGVKSGSGITYWGCNASSPAGQWWQVVFPYKIKITGLTHYNRQGNSYANVTGRFWTSSARTTPIGDAFGATGATGWKATTIQNIPANGVVTNTIYFYITGGVGYAGIGELEITATRFTVMYQVPARSGVSVVPARYMEDWNASATWTTQTSGISQQIYGVAYGNGVYVAVAEGGKVLTSTNLTTWTERTSGTSSTLRDIVYHDGLFVAVMSDSGGGILTSPDGITWTSYSAPSTLMGIIYNDGKFISVGHNSAIAISSDGQNWSFGTIGVSGDYYAIGYGNGLYIAVGSNGRIVTSPDLINWTQRNSGTTNVLRGAAYGNGRWVVVGEYGTVLISVDGINWQSIPPITSTRWTDDIFFANCVFVIVVSGISNGGIYVSRDGESWLPKTTVQGTCGMVNGSTAIIAGYQGNIQTTTNAFITHLISCFPAIAPAHPYAHYEGTIYPIADAPAGAYPLTDLQYYTINYYVNAGGTLRWYSNQRPYVDGYASWTQPVLTSNSTSTALGTVTASASSYYSGEEPYKAMDGIKTGRNACWGCNAYNPSGQWWKVKFPYQINITGITFYNRDYNYMASITGRFWTSDAKTTAIGNAFSTSATAWASTVVSGIPAEGVLTDTIYFYVTDGVEYCGIGELEITATRYATLYEVPLTNFVS